MRGFNNFDAGRTPKKRPPRGMRLTLAQLRAKDRALAVDIARLSKLEFMVIEP